VKAYIRPTYIPSEKKTYFPKEKNRIFQEEKEAMERSYIKPHWAGHLGQGFLHSSV